MHRLVLSPLRDGEERKRKREREKERVAGGAELEWLTVVFNAAPCIKHYTQPPAFLFSAHANHLPPPSRPFHHLIARLAILDALRCPRERDSCGEIELNLEMNIESNELSTSQPASQLPPPNHLLHFVGVPRPSRFAPTLAPFSLRLLARSTCFA